MDRRDRIILQKVLSEIEVAGDLLNQSTLEEFLADEKTKRSICLTVINIGELVKNLSNPFRKEYSSIPWKEIAGFRDIAAHKYFTLRMEDVYETATVDFPALYKEIKSILS